MTERHDFDADRTRPRTIEPVIRALMQDEIFLPVEDEERWGLGRLQWRKPVIPGELSAVDLYAGTMPDGKVPARITSGTDLHDALATIAVVPDSSLAERTIKALCLAGYYPGTGIVAA